MKESTITISLKHDDSGAVMTVTKSGERISDFEVIGLLQTVVQEEINRHNRVAAEKLARKVVSEDNAAKSRAEFLEKLRDAMEEAEELKKKAEPKKQARKPRTKKPITLPKDSSNGKPGDVAK